MTLSGLIAWIVIGGIAGFLADALISGVSLSLLGDVLVGMVGGVVGGWLFNLLDISPGASFLGSLVVAFVGAVVVLLILREVRS